jgi:hypothetical protein
MGITYSDRCCRQVLEEWSRRTTVDGEAALGDHMDVLFGVESVEIHSIRDEGAFVSLIVSTEQCSDPREILLTDQGEMVFQPGSGRRGSTRPGPPASRQRRP